MTLHARREELLRMRRRAAQLREQIEHVRTETLRLSDAERRRPLAAAERAAARTLEQESRRLYLELKALFAEYDGLHAPPRLP